MCKRDVKILRLGDIAKQKPIRTGWVQFAVFAYNNYIPNKFYKNIDMSRLAFCIKFGFNLPIHCART